MLKIIPNNLKRQYALHAEEYEQKALSVLRSGWYILGPEVEKFEAEFASYIGAAHCVGLASGLDALHMSFRLLGIGPGDEVIVCSNAYIACVMGITLAGASPVFVEPNEFFNIDASQMESAITPKTKVILAVHLFGQACDMAAIMDIAGRHHLRVVEDCAQNHGGTYGGQACGTFGSVGCFSFYPTKGCGAFGDGGAIVTHDETIMKNAKVLRNYGSSRRYQFDVEGMNSRLDELQAGLLRVKLLHLEEMNRERTAIAHRYDLGITNREITLPRVQEGATSSWHQYVIRTKNRDRLQAHLEARGIGTLIHYPVPPHLSKAYAHLGYRRGDFPIAEQQADEVLSLPMYNGMGEDELDYVIHWINRFAG